MLWTLKRIRVKRECGHQLEQVNSFSFEAQDRRKSKIISWRISPLVLPVFAFFVFWFILFYFIFIYLWLCWVFVSVRGLSLVAASGGHSSSRCAGLSPSRPLLLGSTGSRRAASVIVAHGPSCSMACGIFPDQGSNPCPLHWQADSQPLRHQGSPSICVLNLPNELKYIHSLLMGAAWSQIVC